MTNHETDRRAQWANALWEAAEHHTIAEWICCDPIDPKHGLCVAGGKALEMLRALIVDDPEAYKPAPLTTVALELAAVSVPPPASQAADRRERYAAAIAEGFRAFDADTTSDAYLDAELLDAVIAAADAEEAELLAAVSVVPPAPRADDQAPVCICGHTGAQHFEDACVTEVTGCDCGDFLTGEAAREVIARWRDAAIQARADRAAVLREAAEALGRMDYDTDSHDYGYDTYRDAWNGGVMDGADLLRRLADEAQQPDDGEGDELVCVDECGFCDACGFEPFGTPAEGWREAARFLRRTARDSRDRRGALHGAQLIEAELRRIAEEAVDDPQPDGPCVAGEQQNETPEATLAAALDGLHTLIATSSRDWGQYRVDAWLWAVLCGWDCEEGHEHDELCDDGAAMREMAAMHSWDDDTVAKARRYRAAVRALTKPAAGVRQDGAQP